MGAVPAFGRRNFGLVTAKLIAKPEFGIIGAGRGGRILNSQFSIHSYGRGGAAEVIEARCPRLSATKPGEICVLGSRHEVRVSY